jgi:hypothetical protein
MSIGAAGPLVVTYPLSERSRAIVAEELGGAAAAVYLADLTPPERAAALRGAGALLAHDTSKELAPAEIPLIRNAKLLQFTAAGIDWVHAINRRGASAEPTDWIATTARLDEMLRAADVFVVCAALTTETAGLIGGRELALMRGDAIFINVARGEIVDEAALYAHLAAHPRFFAGIDACWVEPVRHGRFTMGHPFLNLPNVIGSPHNSAGGGACRDEYLRRAVRNCRRGLLGEAPQNLIGPAERML